MTIEIWALVLTTLLGAVQFALAQQQPVFAQINRNFLETYFIVAVTILVLATLHGFGEWSTKGAVIYAAGRALYVAFSFGVLTRMRKWTWAISIVGLVGCVAELIRVLLGMVM